MKIKFNKILLILLAGISFFALAGCTSKQINSPEDAIIDAYGDRQFRISFDSTDLETPLADVYYSAKNMPILPTPVKVGYVFAGWFFDQSLTQPCDVNSGDLLWKMRDLILYPKWEKEKIVNNGTYDIEFEAKILYPLAEGPLAQGYQEFPKDIIASETYIEKNDKGTFLRIQYDNVVRGPVLGGSASDDSNFSKMTYTVKDSENRINKEMSILDRTNTIQTIYYDISDKKIDEPIIFNIEYYNWKINIKDEDRGLASVIYDVEFKITRFIGFNQSFVNPESKLEDGMYLVPTHYTSLDKEASVLDSFNPVYAYLEVVGGKYTLHKPLNAYNNDFPEVKPNQFPLRTSGYAREFTCFTIDKNKKIHREIEENKEGKYYLPKEINATKYLPVTYEFHSKTGRYYYTVELGDSLDSDLVFIGGSSGAMEQMFSISFDYRRLVLDYNSMVRIVDCDYEPLTGDEYTFKDENVIYPGSYLDFKDSNTDYDIYQYYRQAIFMTNVFFTRNNGRVKVFDTKMTISPDVNNSTPAYARYSYAKFNIQYSAFGYNPMKNGELLARDLTFITNGEFRNSNSFEEKKFIGKTFRKGEKVNLNSLFTEKVSKTAPSNLEIKAYNTDKNLNVDFNNEISVESSFEFTKDMAVYYQYKDKGNIVSSLVYLMEKEDLKLDIIDSSVEWNLENGIYSTNQRFKMGEEGEKIVVPEIRYQTFGMNMSTSNLKKYDEDQETYTDFTKVSIWNYDNGKYNSYSIMPANAYDFVMNSEKIRVMIQITNPFNEFENILFEYRGEDSGEYTLELNGHVLASADIKYKANKRETISYDEYKTINILKSEDIKKIPSKFDLRLEENDSSSVVNINFDYATVYRNDTTKEVTNLDELWNAIKDSKYAVIILYYASDYGDKVICKAQYNFKLDGVNIDDSYIYIDESKTIFNNESFKFRKPMITTNNLSPIDTGNFKSYVKNGFNFEETSSDDINIFNDTYSVDLTFKKSGTYLIILEYTLYKDSTGKFVFDYNAANEYSDSIKINICQEIEVKNRYSDMVIKFATDKSHPFDQNAKDLEGFVFSEDEKYQYMTLTMKSGKMMNAPTQDCFLPTDDLLFVWSVDGYKETVRPGYLLENLSVKTGTLTPTLYAWWDSGIDIEISLNVDGVVKPASMLHMERNPYTGGGYLVFYSQLAGNIIKDVNALGSRYYIYGWEASEPIYSYNGKVTNFHKGGLEGSVELNKKINFTAIIKKYVNINYQAVDEDGNNLEFAKKLITDYGKNKININDNLFDVLSTEKINQLTKASVINMKFSHWEVFDKELNKYVIVDLNNLILYEKYTDVFGDITLRAVFK